MKKVKLPIVIVMTLGLIVFAASSIMANKIQSPQEALNILKANYPEVQLYDEGSSIARVFGPAFGSGSSPTEAAESFRRSYSSIFGVDPSDLRPETFVLKDGNSQQVMFDQETGLYKFTLVYYSQYKDGIPVYRADLRLLVRNEAGYPLVLAASSLRNLRDFQIDPGRAAADPQAVQRAFAVANPMYTKFDDPRLVIWAGINATDNVAPAMAVEFVADDGQTPTTNRFRFFIDPATGEIIYQEDLVIDVNVTGQVRGNATENFKSEQCGNEVATNMPYARVYITSGSPFYADSAGFYTITNGGSSPVTVTSYIRGRFFQTWNQAGAESYLTLTVTPPGPANFMHNPSNTEFNRAEVNGYFHANVVRDYALRFNPTYPTIYNQYDWPVYVNDNTGYCPGNAWYDGYSITFCRAEAGYPNTAYSTVVHHEYGHHLVAMAGSGQGQYGEGMGDVMGVLITDDSETGWGFYGPCNQALRSANNTLQYPCSGEIHDCGQLISGCVWSTRNQLYVTNPTTYRNIISNLAINAMLLHSGTEITPSITIDYLTLDDDDGNIDNGTPHWSEICTGFGAHNMDCPALTLLSFSYPNGRPTYIDPSGGTSMRVSVSGVGGTPQPNTGVLHYNAGSGWQVVNMTQVTPNVYDAIFPATTCGTTVNYYVSARTTTNYTVNDPSNAPSSYYSTVSATSLTTLYQDDFSTNQGWTGTGGLGEWTIGACTGGSGSDPYGGPDPTTDHSPSTDNKVLGNDLGSGSGGDYAANLSTTYYVTSPTINCSGRTNIRLSFWRWLGVEQNIYDHASFDVYNGTSWINLFASPDYTIDESAWTQYSYDVSSYANNNANFKIRFGIGATDAAWQYCGWNIDDIMVTAISCVSNNGTIAGTVTDSHGNVSDCRLHAFDGSNHHGYDTTGVNGAYSISVPAGTYSLALTQVDHKDTTLTDIVVTTGNTTTRNVVMQRLKGSIKGRVTNASAQALPNTRVVAVGSGVEDTTDIGGYYKINDLTDGTFSVYFTRSSYVDTTVSGVNVTPGDTATLNMVMRQAPYYCEYIPGDANGNGVANGLDVTYMVMYLKGAGDPPPDACDCPGHGALYVAADANGSCDFNGLDISFIVNYLKGLGMEPQSCDDCPPTNPLPPGPAIEKPGVKQPIIPGK